MSVCSVCGEENAERARFCQLCGRPLTPGTAGRETRRLVTVLFCDVIGSTAIARGLDAEALRGILAKYFEEMRRAIERHGGSVEKFIGDAVMAVFGFPRAHEDDALRAVRAAFEMRAALAKLNRELDRGWGVSIATRTGIDTGEVVAGGGGDALVTGQAVIVAARLEQAAAPGDILIGPETYRFVRGAVEAELVDELKLKGLEAPTAAHRLLSVAPAPASHRTVSPLVGRASEVASIHRAFQRAGEEQRCELVVVLGQAGVGKSRLIEEFLLSCEEGTTVFRGRCLPYGEGITFWPLASVLDQAAGLRDSDPPEVVRHKIGLLLLGIEEGPLVTERVAQAIGVSGMSAAPDETLWAIRTLFERLARDGPLVLVFEDVHWAEATFIDLIEHITDRSRVAPILLLCESREDRDWPPVSWREGKPNMSIVRVRPLEEENAGELVENLLGTAELAEDVRRRIVDASDGLPLYAEEIVSMMIDEGLLRRDDGHWIPIGDLSRVPIPKTIQALLATRLDSLPPEERAIVDHASIVGTPFYVEEVAALSALDVRPRVASHLDTLVTRGFLRPARSALYVDDAYQFRHILFREVAYGSLSKNERAHLHERYADWLEDWAQQRIEEYEEIVAHHLDQAVRLRQELGKPDERTRRLADRAGERFAASGQRASARGDIAATIALLGRAVELIPGEDRRRTELMPDLVDGLLQTGDLVRASSIAEDMVVAAVSLDDPSLRASAELTSSLVRSILEPKGRNVQRDRRVALEATQVFEKSGEKGRLAAALAELAWSHWLTGESGRMLELAERALALATEVADRLALRDAADYVGRALVLGPMPCDEAVRRIEVLRTELSEYKAVDASVRLSLAVLLGMMNRLEEASDHVTVARGVFEDLGQRRWLAAAAGTAGLIAWWSDSPEAAESDLRSCYEFSREHGGEVWGTEAANLARLLLESGRLDEADEVASTIADEIPEHEVESQIAWRGVRGKILAARGDIEDGIEMAGQGVRLAEGTDFMSMFAPALLDLADCRVFAEDEPRAAELAQRALALFERKGNVVGAASARALLETVVGS